jgi:glutathione reductase (NADPH)
MNEQNTVYDLIVIGGGSGGVRTARWSAGLGAKVALIEKDRLGGTCVVRGCVPKKMMVNLADLIKQQKYWDGYGVKGSKLELDWAFFKQQRDGEINRLVGIYRSILEKPGVDIFEGDCRFVDAQTVEVGGKQLIGKNIVIATGSKPRKPTFEGAELVKTSNEIFHLHEVPKKFLVIGGGYIGLEFASIFHNLGADVNVAIRSGTILREFDQETAKYLGEQLSNQGINLKYKTEVSSVSKSDSGLTVTFTSGESLEVDEVLWAAGRVPNVETLNLNAVGVKLGNKGEVLVDDDFKTSISGVYAVGDCIEKGTLTPVATTQGTILSENLFGKKVAGFDAYITPSSVFTNPEFASIGEAEEFYLSQKREIKVFHAIFRPLKDTLTDIVEKTFLKLIVDRESDKVLAAHMVGPHAGETIQTLAVAIRAGATKTDFDQTIGIHPTSAEEWVTMRTESR